MFPSSVFGYSVLLFLSIRLPAASASALAFLPPGTLSPAENSTFHAAVDKIRAAAVCMVEHSRHGGAHRSADKPMGGILVLPVSQRRVPIAVGFRAHLDAAALLPFPLDSRLRASSLPPDIACAVRRSVEHRDRLPDFRYDRAAAVRVVADRLRPISKRINGALMPPTVLRIAGNFNTLFVAAVVDALRWLDSAIVRRFVYGFPIVATAIPDSGAYRLLPPPPVERFQARRDAFVLSAPTHNRLLHARLTARAAASSADRAADLAVSAKTATEVSKGVVVGPYSSPDAIHSAMARLFPHLPRASVYPRVMPRFGITQKGSIRAIDDGRSNGANAATLMFETVSTPSFFFPAIVARAFAVVALSLGIPFLALVVAMADLAMAYRTVPTSQPWYTAIGFFNPTSRPPAPEYYWLPGHNFGLASAVVNFNRYPEFIVIALRALFALIVDHYYDDFILPDLEAGLRSSLDVLEDFILMCGNGSRRAEFQPVRSPELDPKKTKEPLRSNVVLGVTADLSSASSTPPSVRFRAESERIQSVLAAFRAAYARGTLRPHEASSLRGKLFFVLSSAFGMVGRAATLPLVQRQYRDSRPFSFLPGSELHHSLLFFEALLPSLPPLHVPLLQSRRRPLLVYTDASFSTKRARAGDHSRECRDPHAHLVGFLGAVVYDPDTGVVHVAEGKPNWAVLLASWRDDFKTYIAELEMLAAISVYTTFPSLFSGRSATHYVDNTVALSALVHGYAGKPELAKSVNIFYLQTVALRTAVYFDYVPSKANIADLPSRRMFELLESELVGLRRTSPPHRKLRVPSVAEWDADLTSWAHHSEGERFRFPV